VALCVQDAHREGLAAGCKHNAEVCLRLQQPELANCWRTMQVSQAQSLSRRGLG
jgi:hypothetical protein